MLKQGGYHVISAADGAQALALAAAYRGHIDLLISDVVMPKLGGAALARQLSVERPTLRVLFLSGYSWEGDLTHRRHAGHDRFPAEAGRSRSIHEEGRGAGRRYPVRRGARSPRPRTVRPEVAEVDVQEGLMRSLAVAFGFAIALVACRNSEYVTDKYYQDADVPGAGGRSGGRGGAGGSRTGGTRRQHVGWRRRQQHHGWQRRQHRRCRAGARPWAAPPAAAWPPAAPAAAARPAAAAAVAPAASRSTWHRLPT